MSMFPRTFNRESPPMTTTLRRQTPIGPFTHPLEPIHLAASTRIGRTGYHTLRVFSADCTRLALTPIPKVVADRPADTSVIWVLPMGEVETREVVV